MFFRNTHKSFLKEIYINIAVFAAFEILLITQSVLGTGRIEIFFAGSFSFYLLFLCFIFLKNDENISIHKMEIINYTLLLSNIAFITGLVLYLVDIFIFEPILKMNNAHISNFIIQFILYLPLIYKMYNYDEYFKSARNDYLIKNAFFDTLNLNKTYSPNQMMTINNETETLLAHEVGHLLLILEHLKEGNDIMVSISKDNNSMGFVYVDTKQWDRKKSDLEMLMKYYLGGIIAELYEKDQKNGIEEDTGRRSDMSNFNKIALQYMENGFNSDELYIGHATLEKKDDIIKFNDKSFRNLYNRMLVEGFEYLLEHKDIYEEIKILLKTKQILYTKDLMPFREKLIESKKMEK